ncbi:5-(carboxyamino)imidazole ribonucleotide synthase [Fodinicurvata sp. EGI_FJ10296]|uniref:5-(carboxyamino)imidazole ribonucleotide synthase n=1 Tax=Fodinicurvata sp. EGI_FJ10296 TaxID=3231908 RepID=UPI0034542EB1
MPMKFTSDPIPPGSTIGILGGGQLGRMSALAAAELGYRVHIFAPDARSPAARVSDAETVADFGDRDALSGFADAVDVVTLEFENVPADAVSHLAELVAVRPGASVLGVCQDRVAEKLFAAGHGIATARFAAIDGPEDLAQAAASEFPAILKTRRDGYDGKGQVRVNAAGELSDAWAALDRRPAILESAVAFRRELSVIAARNSNGDIAVFPLAENRHSGGILVRSLAPAEADPVIAERAAEIGRTLAEQLDVVGLLAVELFETANGELLMNEMAPRPHNSGHWTQDACRTSQFEQHIRAVCGLPLGSIAATGRAVMDNLIGEAAGDWPAILSDPEARLHLYDKGEARPGRKMGHVTRVTPL